MAKQKKTRVELRKNRSKPPRERGWTKGLQQHGFAEAATQSGERVRTKGDLSRKRSIIQDEAAGESKTPTESVVMPAVDTSACLPGRVLRVHGLQSVVEVDDGRQ